ncbi:hypothetical protein B0O99DRAFT_640160, partial [Bisporella sp. PMI_857]
YAVLRRAYDKGGILLQYYSVRICGRNLYCSGNKASNYCSNYGTTGYTAARTVPGTPRQRSSCPVLFASWYNLRTSCRSWMIVSRREAFSDRSCSGVIEELIRSLRIGDTLQGTMCFDLSKIEAVAIKADWVVNKRFTSTALSWSPYKSKYRQ